MEGNGHTKESGCEGRPATSLPERPCCPLCVVLKSCGIPKNTMQMRFPGTGVKDFGLVHGINLCGTWDQPACGACAYIVYACVTSAGYQQQHNV